METRGYRYAWIVLWDAEQRVIAATEAGIGESGLSALRERLARGESVACISAALTADGVIVMDDRRTLCGSCPLVDPQDDCTPIAVRLAHGDEVYGAMVAAIPADYAAEPEELEMLEEVAGDISFALYGMRIERERQEAERSLRLEQSRLACLVRLSQMTDADLREITNFALEEAVRLTESGIGYLAFMNQDESVLTMHAWSKTAMDAVPDHRQADHLPGGHDGTVGRGRAATQSR